MNDMNLPFEAIPGGPVPMPAEAFMISGGVVVAAVQLDGPLGKVPALLFRFAAADGSGFYPGVLLSCDNWANLRALPGLVGEAVAAALEASR